MAADPMRIRATLAGGKVEVKVLMSHPMETGQRKSPDGGTFPPHFIEHVTATYNGKVVLSADWGVAVSKNPFLSFRFSGAKKGEKISVTWTDNMGQTRSDETVIA